MDRSAKNPPSLAGLIAVVAIGVIFCGAFMLIQGAPAGVAAIAVGAATIAGAAAVLAGWWLRRRKTGPVREVFSSTYLKSRGQFRLQLFLAALCLAGGVLSLVSDPRSFYHIALAAPPLLLVPYWIYLACDSYRSMTESHRPGRIHAD